MNCLGQRFPLLIFIFLGALPLLVQAQDLKFNHQLLSVEDGLASREVLCGLQDRCGFLWFGTRNGLNRYDGKHFTLLTKRDGLQHNRVVSLAEDKAGNLWIAYGNEEGTRKTDGKTDIYNPVTGELVSFENKFPDAPFDGDDINWMVPNKQGDVFFLVRNALVYRYKSGNIFEKVVDVTDDLDKLKTESNFNPIANGKGIAFNEKYTFFGNRFFGNDSSLQTLSYFNDDGLLEIVAAEKGSKTPQLLIKKHTLDGQLLVEHRPCDSLTYEVLNNLEYFWGHWNEKFGSSIILPLKLGLFIFKDYRCTPLVTDPGTEKGFSSNLSFFADQQGNYWVCTAGGLHKFSPLPKRFQVLFNKAAFNTQDPLGNQMRAIYADATGNVWAGGHFGLVYYEKATGKYHSKIGVHDDVWIHCFDKRENRMYFFGSGMSYMGLPKMEIAEDYARKLNLTPDAYLATIGFTWAVYPMPEQRYLLGNNLGKFLVWNVRDNSFSPVESCGKAMPFSNYIYKIIFSNKDQHYWAVGGSGCYRISKDLCITDFFGTEDVADEQHRMPVSDLRDIYEDEEGIFWMAAIGEGNGKAEYDTANGEGLLRWDRAKGVFQMFTIQDGMPSNTLYCILPDDYGNLWVSTDNGLVRFNKSTHFINVFSSKDGIAHNEFNRISSFKAKDGTMYFGGIDGMTAFHPRDFVTNELEEEIPLQVTGFSQFMGSEDELRDLSHELLTNNEIILHPGDKFFRLEFALLDYRFPSGYYKYQIEGFDKGWQYIAEPLIRISGLPYGDYTLRIAGQSFSGALSKQELVIPIHVLRPYYLRWWAFVFYGLSFLLFLYLFRAYQIKRLLERADNIRLKEIDLMKTKLYTNITHEFRTPLTVISGMASMIEKPEQAKVLITKSSEGLLRLVNQMLDLAKLESGHIEANLKQADVVPFVQYLTESFQSFAAVKDINLVFYKEVDQLFMDYDEGKLESIVFNLLSNAIKFSKDSGKIIVHLREENGHFLLKVKDNGIGIPPNKLAHVFDRFYQVEYPDGYRDTRKSEGTGIGLALTKELVALMEGEIEVKSQPGEGTEFVVSLPIHRNAPVAEAAAPTIAVVREDWPSAGLEDAAAQDDLPLLLLIEDNHDVATFIRACVQERYTVEWAKNGAAGIEMALETIPDIIISDVMMPEKDGFEVCQTLKNDERTDHIPIILLTAKAGVESRLEGLGVGADAYLSKPFLKEELFIRLEKLIELRRRLQEKFAGGDFISATPAAQPPSAAAPGVAFLEKASLFILGHLDDTEFGNEELAREMAMSESQLNRKVKALTGKTLSVFIRGVRLQQGKILLQTTSLNVSEIAYAVGFADPSYFSRTFSQEFGFAPSKFRN